MNTNAKRISIIAVILILGLVGWLIFRSNSSDDNGTASEGAVSTKLQGGETQVTGTISCLPSTAKADAGGCVKAIKGDDGKTYALNTIKVRGIEATFPEGAKVMAIGVYEPANTTIDESNVFTYDGVLVVRVLQRR